MKAELGSAAKENKAEETKVEEVSSSHSRISQHAELELELEAKLNF